MLSLTYDQLRDEDPVALKTFRLVSKACRDSSEMIFFRTVTLHDKSKEAMQVSEDIIKRLQDPTETLNECVLHLKMGPCECAGYRSNYNSSCHVSPSGEVLTQLLHRLENLQSFRYV